MAKKKNETRRIAIKFAEDGTNTEEVESSQEDDLESGLAHGEVSVVAAAKGSQAEESSDEPVDEDSASGVASSELQVQVDGLLAERSALYDRLLRQQAEFENYRKRIERERSEVFQRSRVDVLLEMIPILDNLERALGSLEHGDSDADALWRGVELIHRQFKDALMKFGLQPVESVGCTFDPHFHEAVTIEPTDEHVENTVIEEFERGYKIGDRLLRAAKVKVASNPDR